MPLTFKSAAKINLYLEVVNKRPDGYHNIRTLFERIGLFDRLSFLLIPQDKIEIYCDNPQVPCNETNLAFRAAAFLKKDFFVSGGVKIKIDKRIPVAAGLGGGSSNAAATLLALNRLWELELGKNQLMRYARKLGADVAFFVSGATFALGTQKGDKIKPLPIKKAFWHILAVCDLRVSTKEVYERYREDLRLTKPKFNTKILTYALSKGRVSALGRLIYNDLERVTARKYRRVAEIIEWFKKQGVVCGMSGSGPSVFAIVPTRREAEEISRRLRRLKDLRVWTVRTC